MGSAANHQDVSSPQKHLSGKFLTYPVCTGENLILSAIPALPDRADSMNHIPGFEHSSCRDDCFPRWTRPLLPADPLAFLKDLRPASSMYRPIHPALAKAIPSVSPANGYIRQNPAMRYLAALHDHSLG